MDPILDRTQLTVTCPDLFSLAFVENAALSYFWVSEGIVPLTHLLNKLLRPTIPVGTARRLIADMFN